MRNEWPNEVPQPWDTRMELMCAIALCFTMGRMAPRLSRQENSGSLGPAGTMVARLSNACIGQS